MPISDTVKRIRQAEMAAVKQEVDKVEEKIVYILETFSRSTYSLDTIEIFVSPCELDSEIQITVRFGEKSNSLKTQVAISYTALAGGLLESGFDPISQKTSKSRPIMKLTFSNALGIKL